MTLPLQSFDHTMGHRVTKCVVTVLGRDGQPLANTDIIVQQRRHAFGFGNIGRDFIPLANGETVLRREDVETFGGAAIQQLGNLADLWLDLFNTATLPFYWGLFEPVRGNPDTERLRKAAKWFVERGVEVKGHPLVWHGAPAPWLLNLSLPEVERTQRARIRRDVEEFAGLINTWDAINEPVIMPVFAGVDNGITRLAHHIGRIPLVRLAFEEARTANPHATLLVNDFDVSSAYECLIEGVLEAGLQIDAIGLQTQMYHGYWGEQRVLAMVDRFARFGLPLHLTENVLLSGQLIPPEIEDRNGYQVSSWPSTPEGEERQAVEIERHYRSLVSHPAVESITYWGFTDNGARLGAPVGLVRSDGAPKPSYDALRRLIKEEWWMEPTRMRTNLDGAVVVSGFLGDYLVNAADGVAQFSLAAGLTRTATTMEKVGPRGYPPATTAWP